MALMANIVIYKLMANIVIYKLALLFTRDTLTPLQMQSVAYAGNFHGGVWLRVIWWSFVFGLRCL